MNKQLRNVSKAQMMDDEELKLSAGCHHAEEFRVVNEPVLVRVRFVFTAGKRRHIINCLLMSPSLSVSVSSVH